MKYRQFFVLLLCCIANINLTTANINKISSHANPPTTVTVYFNANGGNSENMPASVSIEYGSMYGDVTGTWNWIASKSGFNFIGWNTAADGSGYFVGPVSHCAETTTHTLYAIFEEASSQDVSLCPDESSVISASSGARQYEWQTTTGLDNANIQSPTLSASALTPGSTYDYVCKLEAKNYIYNYNFNLGNVGFYSDYQWSDTAIVEQDNLYKQRTYGYISDAHNAHPAWFNIRSHNNDGGKFMICNGGALPDDIVWEEAVKVEPNTNYVFSAWAANVFIEEDTVAAELQLYVNGTAIGGITKVIYHDWIKIEAYWNSGSNQYAALQIKNHATRDTGNDFGLDDIEFYPADGSYDTITVTVNPTFTPGAISSTGQTIHQGGAAATIGNVTSAAGGNGNISYQWFEGSNAIEGATSASYKPGSAYTETMGVYTFTRKAKDETCATTFTTSEGSYVLTTIEPVHTVLGLTRTGKEVDCSTMDPEEDKTITEHGKIVTSPRVTRNGKIITEECSGCGTDLSITDTVDCTSITLKATITDGDPTSAILKVYSDAAHTSQLGSDINATISGDEISAVASGLNCHTRYHFMLETTDASGTCTFDWTDSTRDMTQEKVTTCTVASVRALGIGSDLSHEHGYNGSTTEIDSVYDHEGNAYAVVQIGEQCWLKENMRAVTRPNGDTILQVLNTSSDLSLSSPRVYYYENDINNYYKYGCLYNFPAAMDIDDLSKSFPYPHRGICPEGWHVPSDEDWTTLATNAGVGVNTGGTGAGKLAGGCDWRVSPNATAPGNYSYSDRNATSFYALPAAGCHGSFHSFTAYANFWSTLVENANNQVYYRDISFEHEYMGRVLNPRNDAYSVRCMRDPIITDTITFDANNGNGVMPQQIVARGTKVALDSNKFTHTGTYAFIGWNTQRNGYGTAYADADSIVTNGNVTLYAQWHTYCSGNIRSNEAGSTRIDSVRDVDNNWYKVIEIGTQCWLAENLRVTHGQNTGAITQANTNTESATQPYYYDYTSSDLTLRERGLLYNWSAAVDSTFDALSSESYTNRQGICPDGWHLPSDQEWFIMEKNTLIHDGIWDTVTLAENSGILAERDTHISGAGRWVTGDENAWESDTHETSPGNFFYSERNMIGLNVIPTGDYKPALHPQHGLTDDGIGANFWTSTTSTQGSGYAVGRDVDNSREAVLRHYYEKEFGRSVRCIRDLPLIPEFSLCEDTTFGTVTLKEIKNAEKIEFIQGTTVKKTVNNPASEFIVSDLAEGSYIIKATSSTEDTVVDNAYIKHTYTHCTGIAHAGTNLSGGKWANKEWSSVTNQIDSVSDHEGNVYEVVQIGNQCWLKENMRATTSVDGTPILKTTLDGMSETEQRAYYYNDDPVKAAEYGVLYNWLAAMNGASLEGTRGICPQGWHLPSDTEWTALEKIYLTDGTNPISDISLNTIGFRGKGAGKFASSCKWNDSDNTTSPCSFSYAERNVSGFSAIPAGNYNGAFYAINDDTYFYSSTLDNEGHPYARYFNFLNEGINRTNNLKNIAYSIRCVRDVLIPEFSLCEDTTFGTLTMKEIKNTEKIEFIQEGAVKKTVNNPAAEILVSDLAEGSYKIKATSSTEDTVVDNAYIKHTYTHCTGIAHTGTDLGGGKWANKEWSSETNQIDSVSDHEGNIYEVVQIGNQCWLKENMRCTTSPKDHLSKLVTMEDSSYEPMYYDYNSTSGEYPQLITDIRKRGILYNWAGAMDSTFAVSPTVDCPNHQGICPIGWHLPTESEWMTLEKAYLAEEDGTTPISDATLNEMNAYRGSGAGKFATGCDWAGTRTTTTPNTYSYADRNVTGFSALPAGCNVNGLRLAGNCAYFWSATPNLVGYAYNRYFYGSGEGIHRNGASLSYAFSVRCVRNLAGITLGAVTKTDSTANSLSISAGYTATKTVTSATICAYTNEDCTESATPICATGSDVTIGESAITGTIEGLEPNTQYYVKVTATTEDDNASNVGGSFGTKTCIIPTLGLCETCNEGTITVKVSENVESIVWRNASNDSVSNSMTGLTQSATIPAGIYTATAKSSDGCTVTRTAVLGEYVAHPCTVTSLRAGTLLEGGKYANKEYGTGTQLDSVSDHEGNVYRVVQIGDQCWLAENMRATTEPDGTNILQIPASGKEWSEPRAYYNDNDAANYAKYGCLYNWPAAMNGANSEGARGICPDGWHIPTEAEWEKLCENAGVGFRTGDNAGKLAGGCDWLYTSTPPTDFTAYPYDGMRWIPSYASAATGPGDYSYAERNSTGFSALPAGDYFDDVIYGLAPNSFSTVGFMAEFWCSTMNGPFGGFCFLVHHSSHLSLPYGEHTNNMGYSVRCLRDDAGITLGAVTKTDSTANSLSISAGYTATKTVTSATICAYTNEDCTEPATPICATGSDVTIGESAITGIIEGLEPNTQYYVKVTATTEDDNASNVGGPFGTKTCIIPTLGLCETCNEGTITVKVSENVESIVWRNASNDSVSNSMTGLTQSATIPAGVYTATAKSSDGLTVTRTAVLGKYVAHPCTVTSLRAGTLLEGGKYANKEYGTGTKLDSVSDHEGNVYRVVQIGDQCWLAENMRATTSPSSHKRILMNMVPANFSKAACWYKNDSTTYSKYGVLYNWCAAVDTFYAANGFPELANEPDHEDFTLHITFSGPRRGICPEGWHVPMWEETRTLITNAGLGVNKGTGVGKLVGGCDWQRDSKGTAPGNYSYSDRNATGFSMLPAGAYNYTRSFVNFGHYARYWDASPDLTYVIAPVFSNDYEYVYHKSGASQYCGHSVRCLRDDAGVTLGAVTKTDYTRNSLSISAAYTATKTVTSATICAYTNEDCTEPATPICATGSDVTIGESAITATIEGLAPNTQYYVKVSVTTGDGTESKVGDPFGTKACIIPTLGLCETCNEGTITVKVSENVESIVWRNASNDSVSNSMTGLTQSATIPAGIYTATAKSSDGCTVTRTAVLGKYVAHPCTVTSLRAGTDLGDGKYANKEYGTNNQLDSVSDHEGNVYRVVQIGDQCWLAENMRATTSPSSHKRILMNMVSSYSSKSAGWYNNDSTTYSKYGVLYNWCAAVDTFLNDGQTSHPELANETGHSSTDWPVTMPAGPRRGICPEGWHVPTEAEWSTMPTAAGCTASYESGTGLGKLAGGCDWSSSSTATAPGDYSYTDRNSSGFYALPAGLYNGSYSSFTTVDYNAGFWSSTPFLSSYAYRRSFGFNREYMYRYTADRNGGHSVRCVRDNE